MRSCFIKYILLTAFILSQSSGVALYAAEVPLYDIPEKRVEMWSALLQTMKNRYSLQILDDFNSGVSWDDRGNSSSSSFSRFIRKFPESAAYQKELKLIEKNSAANNQTAALSYMIYTSFHTPGRENYTIHPRTSVKINGIPKRVSFWLKGDGTLHSLFLLFRDLHGHEVPVYAGKLEYNTWKRFEIELPDLLKRLPDRLNRDQRKYLFTGIRIVSHPSEQSSHTSIILDSILLLTQPYPLQYPGMIQEDNW